MPGSEPTVFKNVCPLDCPDTCSMLVTVEDGVAVELRGDPDHPFTRGFLCQKMARYLDRVYSPDRLLYPMKRVGREGRRPVRADLLGRGARDHRRAVRRDRRVAGRAAGDPALQLLRHDGQAPVQQPGPAVLPPAGRLEARPDDLRVGRLAGLRIHDGPRPAGGRPAGRAEVQVHRQLGLEHRQHQQPPLEPDDRGPQGTARRSSPSTPTAARPPPLRLAHPAPRPGTDAALALG